MTFFDSDALLDQALSYHREGNLDQAEQIYELILRETPSVSCIYSFLGCIKREKKKYNEAIALFHKAIRLDPANGDYFYNLGNVFFEMSNWSDAVYSYQKAIGCNQFLSPAFLNLGHSYVGMRNFRSAIQCFETVISLNPDDSNSYLNLANCLNDAGLTTQAIATYRRALGLNASSCLAYLGLGMAFKRNSQFMEGAQCFLALLRLDSSFSEGWYRLFQCHKEIELLGSKFSGYEDLLANEVKNALAKDRVICFGDCHISVFQGLNNFEAINVGPATAYALNSEASKTQGKLKILKRLSTADIFSDAVLFSFGEIDLRANIFKNVYSSGSSLSSVCCGVVNGFFGLIDEVISLGFRVIVYGAWGSGSDHDNIGSSKERHYAATILNQNIITEASKRQICFFSLFDILSSRSTKGVRTNFFDDSGMHFFGHPEKISTGIKCIVLAQFLAAIDAPATPSAEDSMAIVQKSVFDEELYCLVDVFSGIDHGNFYCDQWAETALRIKRLSSARKSLVFDLLSSLRGLSCRMIFEGLQQCKSMDDWEVLGLDKSDNISKAEFEISYSQNGSLLVAARFSPNILIRYLMISFPDLGLSQLSEFDITSEVYSCY